MHVVNKWVHESKGYAASKNIFFSHRCIVSSILFSPEDYDVRELPGDALRVSPTPKMVDT